MPKTKRPIIDAVEILHRRYYQGRPDRLSALEKARANDSVARKLTSLRLQVGLTQRQLARLVGTTASAICGLENADYEGHSLVMLNRIAAALKLVSKSASYRSRNARRQKRHDRFLLTPCLFPPSALRSPAIGSSLSPARPISIATHKGIMVTYALPIWQPQFRYSSISTRKRDRRLPPGLKDSMHQRQRR